MLTYFRTRYGKYGPPNGAGYTPNEYFSPRLDGEHILLTTRHRAWVILDPDEYELFLRRRLQKNTALYSVLEDLGVILTPRNAKDIATIHCARYSFLHQPPALFIMVVTNRCNMVCSYCHAKAQGLSAKEWDMSEEVLYKTVNFFFSVPRRGRKEIGIEFQGGETLLRYDLVQKAMDYATQRAEKEGLEIHFAIVTNLTLMKPEIIADIKRRGNVRLCSSMDGPAEVHDRHRTFANGRGTHKQVLKWAEELRHEHEMEVPLLTTFTAAGVGREKEIVDQYLEQGLAGLSFRYVLQMGRAHEQGFDMGLTAPQYIESWKRILNYILEKNREGQPFRENQTAYLLGNMLNSSHRYMCLGRPCGIGASMITVHHDGTIYGCDAGKGNPMLAMGNVMADSYDDIYTGQMAMAFRSIASETLPMCRTCAFNAYCGYCVARVVSEHGTPIAHIPSDFEHNIYAEMIPHLFKKLLDREDAAILNSWV